MDDCQLTAPDLPKPVCDAPDAKATVLPDSPTVKVDPDSTAHLLYTTHLLIPLFVF